MVLVASALRPDSKSVNKPFPWPVGLFPQVPYVVVIPPSGVYEIQECPDIRLEPPLPEEYIVRFPDSPNGSIHPTGFLG